MTALEAQYNSDKTLAQNQRPLAWDNLNAPMLRLVRTLPTIGLPCGSQPASEGKELRQ